MLFPIISFSFFHFQLFTFSFTVSCRYNLLSSGKTIARFDEHEINH